MWEACSPCAGFCVSLGERFFSLGYREVDANVLPALEAKASDGVIPRVLPSYAFHLRFAIANVCHCVTVCNC